MGGLFSAPKPTVAAVAPSPRPAAPAPPTPTVTQVAEAARIEARERAARGRAGTVATSERGVLAALPMAARKTLLGE